MFPTGGTIIHYQIKVNHILERGLPNIAIGRVMRPEERYIDDYS